MIPLPSSLPLHAPRPTLGRRSAWRGAGLVLLVLLLALASLNTAAADKKTRNTLIGAGLGAAGGALLTHGDVWGTLGGAAAGGLIGNVATHNNHHRGRDRDRGRDRRDNRYDDRGRRYGH